MFVQQCGFMRGGDIKCKIEHDTASKGCFVIKLICLESERWLDTTVIH